MNAADTPQPDAGTPPTPEPRTDRGPRRLRFSRPTLWFILAALGCCACVAANYCYHCYQTSNTLRATLAALDREEPGWRLADLETARGVVADADNSALRVEQADVVLRQLSVDGELHVRLVQLPPNERPRLADAAALRKELIQGTSALEQARELADLPSGRFPLHYQRNTFAMLPPHRGKAAQVVSWFCSEACLRADDGDLKAALRSCRAALNAGRSLGDEPLPASQLERAVCAQDACLAIERVLAQGEPDATDLGDLQALLEVELRYPRLFVLKRGERALLSEMLEAVESGDVPLADLLKETWPRERVVSKSLRSVDDVRADHPQLLRLLTAAVGIAQLPAHERAARIDALESKIANGPPLTPIACRLLDLRNADYDTRSADARLGCAVTALAVERYRLRHGGWPESLHDLTPALLSAVPLDPKNGEPLSYRRYADRVVVYSRLGAQTSPPFPGFSPPTEPDADAATMPGVGAVHLFDVQHRRQPPNPNPPPNPSVMPAGAPGRLQPGAKVLGIRPPGPS